MIVQVILDKEENDVRICTQCHILQTRGERERMFYVWGQFGYFHLAVHPSPLASSAVIQMCENIDQNYSFCRGRPGESDDESVLQSQLSPL